MPDPAVSGTRNEPLSEMLRIDEICQRFEAAWKSGDRPLIEEYCRDTPEPERSSLVKELLSLELTYREQLGEEPSKEEYLRRFPEHQDVLRPLLDTVRSAPVTEGERGASREPIELSAKPTESLPSRQGGMAAKTKELAATASSPPLPSALESPLPRITGFEVLALLGRGGMGIVYLARQLKLGRKVALKVLPPALAGDPERLRRFRNEAEIAAKLADCRIVPVLDIIEADGSPILVMQFIEGCDLGRIIADRHEVRAGESAEGRHPWATLSDQVYLDHILPVLDMVLESVVALHQGQVVHRDIKPSNILIDQRNNAWLGDFGLARLGQGSGITCPGVGVGTHGFMSPEQWEGREDVGPLSDVFSVGATLYQALTLELPYGRERISDRSHPPLAPSKRQRLLSFDFDTVLLKALEPELRNRYTSARDFLDDWRLVRQDQLPKARRTSWGRRVARQVRRHRAAMTGLILMALVAVGTFMLGSSKPERDSAQGSAPAEIQKRTVELNTQPPGATVVFVPLDEYGSPRPEHKIKARQRTPLIQADVHVGEYLVIAKTDDGRFHEVYRTVPYIGQAKIGLGAPRRWEEKEGGNVELPPIEIPTLEAHRGMAKFVGGSFTMGSKTLKIAPEHTRTVDAFYLDCHETTIGEFRAVLKGLPQQLNSEPKPDNFPVTFVSYNGALAYAEALGKRLPDEAEHEFAATNGGRTQFPWPDSPRTITEWPFGPVGIPEYDRTNTDPPVYGLFSNVAEWTSSGYTQYPTADPSVLQHFQSPEIQKLFRDVRVVRGGPEPVVMGMLDPKGKGSWASWDPRYRTSYTRDQVYPGLGFRCARSVKARFLE
jgi:serine/threonine-protein kinase